VSQEIVLLTWRIQILLYSVLERLFHRQARFALNFRVFASSSLIIRLFCVQEDFFLSSRGSREYRLERPDLFFPLFSNDPRTASGAASAARLAVHLGGDGVGRGGGFRLAAEGGSTFSILLPFLLFSQMSVSDSPPAL
jgi:hypothetical protein